VPGASAVTELETATKVFMVADNEAGYGISSFRVIQKFDH